MLSPISYINNSGSTIPAHGVFQADGTITTTATGDYAIGAVKPGKGFGPYLVDSGKGSSTSGAKQYGHCYTANEGYVWLAFTGSAPTAGSPCGPARSSFSVSRGLGGFRYAGVYDSGNGRILAIADRSKFHAKCTGSLTAGSLTTPQPFTVNVWVVDTTSGASPVPQIVTTAPELLGLTVQNRSNMSTSTVPTMFKISWLFDECEWGPDWGDC